MFPRADYRSDKKIAEAWNSCFAALRLVLDRYVPGYDFERFDTIMAGERMLNPEGLSKKHRRILSLFAVIVSAFLFWQYHDYAMQKARIAGRGDVWSKMCEDHPKLAVKRRESVTQRK